MALLQTDTVGNDDAAPLNFIFLSSAKVEGYVGGNAAN